MNVLQEQVKKGVKILKAGGIVAFPTDTVYGLGADAFNSKAVERIYEVKNRPRHMSFPLLISDLSQISTIAAPASQVALFLAKHFWPGGLTLILLKTASLPTYLANQSTIAVRIPNHPIPLALIQGLGRPIIGTSANISGKLNNLTIGKVKQQLGDKVDLIIDAGKCPNESESTIVDVTGEMPAILRQGIIPKHEIEKAYDEYCRSKG